MLVHWILTTSLFIASLTTFWLALFRSGENGHGHWFLLFWLSSIGLALSSCFLLGKLTESKRSTGTVYTTAVTAIIFVFTSPIGLLAFFAIPLIFVFYVYVLTVILATFYLAFVRKPPN